jgi:hypothetical protein
MHGIKFKSKSSSYLVPQSHLLSPLQRQFCSITYRTFFFPPVGLEFELRVSCLQSWCSTIQTYFQHLFLYFSFQIGSCVNLPTIGFQLWSSFLCLPHSQDYRFTPTCLLTCWDGISLTFCLGWHWTMILLIAASWVAGITGVSHYTLSFLWYC